MCCCINFTLGSGNGETIILKSMEVDVSNLTILLLILYIPLGITLEKIGMPTALIALVYCVIGIVIGSEAKGN